MMKRPTMSISKAPAWRAQAINNAAAMANPLLTSKVDFLEGREQLDEDSLPLEIHPCPVHPWPLSRASLRHRYGQELCRLEPPCPIGLIIGISQLTSQGTTALVSTNSLL